MTKKKATLTDAKSVTTLSMESLKAMRMLERLLQVLQQLPLLLALQTRLQADLEWLSLGSRHQPLVQLRTN